MKRTIDPCQTGWESFDPRVDIGLLTIYQSISNHTDSDNTIYRPHHFPLKTIPQHLFTQRKQMQKVQGSVSRTQREDSKFIANRLNFKERIKRFLITNGRMSNRNSFERQTHKQKNKVKQQPIKIQQFQFEQKQQRFRVNEKLQRQPTKKSMVTYLSESNGGIKRKILSVKDELQKIIKQRRQNKRYDKNKVRTKSEVGILLKLEQSENKKVGHKEQQHLYRQKLSQIKKNERYATLQHYRSLQQSIESYKSQQAQKNNKFLECTIINLGHQQSTLGLSIRRRRYQNKSKSQIKRPRPLGREWGKGKEIYRSNLLLDFEDKPTKTNFTELRAVTPDQQVHNIKNIIRQYMNGSKISPLHGKLQELEKMG